MPFQYFLSNVFGYLHFWKKYARYVKIRKFLAPFELNIHDQIAIQLYTIIDFWPAYTKYLIEYSII